jgi:hypothetical protein
MRAVPVPKAAVTSSNRDKLLGQIWARMPRPTAGSANHTHEEIVGGRRIVREIWARPGAGITFPHLKPVVTYQDEQLGVRGVQAGDPVGILFGQSVAG